MGEEDQLKAVWFAAGTAAFMACIERAVVESLFAHWRVWAFLALNLLLLAILFTSSNQKYHIQEEIVESEFNEKSQESEERVSSNGCCDHVKLLKRDECLEYEKKEEECSKQEEAGDQLSKEELNQRVEAFIAKFRKHLVSDAMGKSCWMHSSTQGKLVESSRVNFVRGDKFIRA